MCVHTRAYAVCTLHPLAHKLKNTTFIKTSALDYWMASKYVSGTAVLNNLYCGRVYMGIIRIL